MGVKYGQKPSLGALEEPDDPTLQKEAGETAAAGRQPVGALP